MLLQVLSTICAASVYVSQLTPFCAGGLYAEGKEYCNAECIDPCANIPQAACLISPVPFYCQARCIPTTPPLADSVMSICMSNGRSRGTLWLQLITSLCMQESQKLFMCKCCTMRSRPILTYHVSRNNLRKDGSLYYHTLHRL